jgi:D-alanine-D-alanine ligase
VQALVQGLQTAAIYDQRIVVEEGIDAREIELAILERAGERSGERPGDLLVSQPGEICLPPGQWYDYDNKYLNDVATLAIPADLPSDAVATLQRLATRSFRATGCSGLARVDFLVDRRTGQPYLNELNTMPGFTSISMYPKLIEHSGISYTELVTRLCELAVSRHRRRAALKIDR